MRDGGDKRTMSEFWSKDVSISGDHLRKVLEALKWDLQTFYASYNKEISGENAPQQSPPEGSEEFEALLSPDDEADYAELLLYLSTSHSVIADDEVCRLIRYRHLPH